MSLVERVARVIVERCAEEENFDKLPPENKKNALDVARAAIAAMREPTEAMQISGAATAAKQYNTMKTWQAMIDTALEKINE